MPKLDWPSDILLDTSTIASTHHGASNAVLLPPVMRFNATVAADRLKDLATAMSAEPTVDAAIQRVLELNRRCRIGTLRDYWVTEEDMVPHSCQGGGRRVLSLQPREVSEEDMIQLYREEM